MRRFLHILLCIFILAFLLLSPGIIAGGLHKNIFSVMKEKEEDAYRGELEFWHVVSFKTGGESGFSLLKARCARFEKNTPYVFVNLKGITIQEANEKLAAGEQPDLISFPFGLLNGRDFCALEENESVSQTFSRIYDRAYPYMFDSYVLLVNGDAFFERGLEMPYGDEMSLELFYTALNALSAENSNMAALALTATPGLNPEMAVEFNDFPADRGWAGEDVEVEPISAYRIVEGGSEAFLNGEAAMLVCPYSEYRQIQQDDRAGYLSISAYHMTDYTDIIQFVGVYRSEDGTKEAMCKRLAASLLSTGVQRQLEELLMLPVVEVTDIYASDYERYMAYTTLREGAILPNSIPEGG